MSLPWREKLAMLLPPSWFYGRRIAYETGTGEPELAVLDRLMRRGGTAVDVGANQGFFAFALSALATRVVCFEPNPDYAAFARWMLRGRAEVHTLALADKPGNETFYVPHSDEGLVLHLAGSLKRAHHQFKTIESYPVEVRTLDSFRLSDVTFIKIDVEGSEPEVLEGLTRPVPALAFEFLPRALEQADACIARLGFLGEYVFNWSSGETHRLAERSWLSDREVRAALRSSEARRRSGDVYARIAEPSNRSL